jgi:hypothetical protein
MSGNWLPEVVHLHLTAFEAGALMCILREEQKRGKTFPVDIPDANGNPIPSDMDSVLLSKLHRAVDALNEPDRTAVRRRIQLDFERDL